MSAGSEPGRDERLWKLSERLEQALREGESVHPGELARELGLEESEVRRFAEAMDVLMEGEVAPEPASETTPELPEDYELLEQPYALLGQQQCDQNHRSLLGQAQPLQQQLLEELLSSVVQPLQLMHQMAPVPRSLPQRYQHHRSAP